MEDTQATPPDESHQPTSICQFFPVGFMINTSVYPMISPKVRIIKMFPRKYQYIPIISHELFIESPLDHH